MNSKTTMQNDFESLDSEAAALRRPAPVAMKVPSCVTLRLPLVGTATSWGHSKTTAPFFGACLMAQPEDFVRPCQANVPFRTEKLAGETLNFEQTGHQKIAHCNTRRSQGSSEGNLCSAHGKPHSSVWGGGGPKTWAMPRREDMYPDIFVLGEFRGMSRSGYLWRRMMNQWWFCGQTTSPAP